jgi:quinoprotein glucose dehydrogenase
MPSPDYLARRWCILACLLVIPAGLPGHSVIQQPAGLEEVRLTPAEAARLAAEARQKASVEIAPGLELKLWASERLLVDPVAVDLDEQGTAYVTSTSRNNLPLDIRQHPDWYPIVHSLKTVEDLLAFYRRELAPARSATNTWIVDLNKDGSHDWRDFSELKERLYRIQDTDGDGLADASRVIAEGFNDDPSWDVAGGILAYGGDLFLGVAPGVYRLRDGNGDGVIDQRFAISEGYNIHPAFGGHGISGVTIGPDGRLYWEVGDIGMNVVDKDGRRWAYPNQGAVLRANPDGSGFEVFATGIRNLQEFAFDELGNLISVDNDGDHAGETERLVYIPEGSDSGWRSNWQYGKYTDERNNRYNVWMDEAMFKPRFDGQAAHIVPPVAPYHAGPSGMVYNPGTALSEEWRNHFVVSSFPGSPANARIHAFRLKEEGAGFALESDKVLLRGILTVGMKFGPDGALYLTDWIAGWRSKNSGRLWKLDATQPDLNPVRREVASLLPQNFSGRPAADLSPLLRHVDMRIRQKAQFELARRGDVQTLLASARDTAHRLGRIHGLWGLGQLARTARQHPALLTEFLKDADDEIVAQTAKLLGDVRYGQAGEALIPLLAHRSARVRFFAAEALGRLAYKPAGVPLVRMLADNDDRDVLLRHAGSLALARLGDAAALGNLSQHASRGVRLAAIVALRRMRHAEVARFLADADGRVVTEAARAINDDGSIPAALPALARLLEEKKFHPSAQKPRAGEPGLTNEPLLRRAVNANLRSGTKEALARLAAFAADAGRSEEMRVEAVSAIGVWAAPSSLDRVDGMHLETMAQSGRAGVAGSARAGMEDAGAAVLRLMETSPKTKSSGAMKAALAVAAGRLSVKAAAPLLLAQLRADASPEARLAALRALQALNTGNMDEVMRIALADSDPDVRRGALGILPALPLTEAAKVQHLASSIKTGAADQQQGAFEVLGKMKSPDAQRLLSSQLDDLAAGKVPLAVQIDLVDAAQSTGSAPLQAKLDAYAKARGAGSVVTAFREALAQGGDARRGYQVFADHPAAACQRCHTFQGEGSDVAPDLTRIGAALSREQLVESLLEPNARVAPGFGTVAVTLRTGQRIEATLKEETPTHIVLVTGTPPAEQRIAKADIAERTNPVSAMPPMGLILKPRELRDLVEFLSVLK